MDLINVKDENEKNELLDDLKKSPKNDKKDLEVKKKQLTLNLGSSKPRKRTVNNNNSVSSLLDSSSAIWTPSMSRVILESPDVQMLKLHTPDVEKFILNSNLNSTPTPSLANRRFYDPTQLIKQLGDNFNDNFNSKNNSNSDSSRPPSNASSNYFPSNDPFTMQDDNSNGTSMISGNNSNCSFNTSNNSTNNQSYIENNSDLESLGVLKNQELSKLERKRLRNRIAASKCRKRKLERISNLENRVQQLKGENTELTQLVIKLKENINHLKQEVLEHMKNGCNINTSLVQN